ncbi:MAG: hypothetical protein AAFX50_26360, partial [Acidobacteriota bacterium]
RRPVVYLGGDGDVDYVLDLSRLAPARMVSDAPRAAGLGPRVGPSTGAPAGPVPAGGRSGVSASARPALY